MRLYWPTARSSDLVRSRFSTGVVFPPDRPSPSANSDDRAIAPEPTALILFLRTLIQDLDIMRP